MNNLIIEQKITPFANQYQIFEASADGIKGNIIAFAQQKRLAFREEITFYTNESKSAVAFTVKAENVLDYHGKFLVSDSGGNQLGAVRKNFKSSLIRSTWEILEGDTIVCVVREASQFTAAMRRIWGFIPFIGEFPFIFKYHFDFLRPDLTKTYGRYMKTTLLLDHYRLTIIDQSLQNEINWQTMAAQCVLLDALQGR